MPNDENPWGKRSNDGPPDLLNLIKKFFSKTGSSSGGGGDQVISTRYFLLAILGLVVIWFLSGFFLVNAREQAVITRFGRYVQTDNPGLHWIPRFIEAKTVKNVQLIRIYKYRADMLTVDTDNKVTEFKSPVKASKPASLADDEGANDISIVVAAITVNYRIDSVRDYLFNTANPLETLQEATSSALRQEVGHMQLESVLSTGREKLRQTLRKRLIRTMALYNTGIHITDVTIQKTETPEEVRPAFLDVIKAQGEKNAFINIAEAYKTQRTQFAQGASAKLLAEANAYKTKVVKVAEGDVSRFNAMLTAYLNSPKVTQDRLYYDALQQVFSHTTNIVLDSKGNNVIYLPLDQLLKQHGGGQQAARVSERQPEASVNDATATVDNNKASTSGTSGYTNSSYQGYSQGEQQ
jgi:modulator of FtsH protease HflK